MLMENIMSIARVLLSHCALTALPRQVAPARTMENRLTTLTPPQVNGPHGCSFQSGATQTMTRGPPSSDSGEKASSALWKPFSRPESLNSRVSQDAWPLSSAAPPSEKIFSFRKPEFYLVLE